MRLLFSNYSGNLNLGTGLSNPVGAVCKIISELTNTKIINLRKKVDGQQEFRFNINLINKLTGWKPKLGLKEGLRLTIKKINYYNGLKK